MFLITRKLAHGKHKNIYLQSHLRVEELLCGYFNWDFFLISSYSYHIPAHGTIVHSKNSHGQISVAFSGFEIVMAKGRTGARTGKIGE